MADFTRIKCTKEYLENLEKTYSKINGKKNSSMPEKNSSNKTFIKEEKSMENEQNMMIQKSSENVKSELPETNEKTVLESNNSEEEMETKSSEETHESSAESRDPDTEKKDEPITHISLFICQTSLWD